jgi:hypothetical protein
MLNTGDIHARSFYRRIGTLPNLLAFSWAISQALFSSPIFKILSSEHEILNIWHYPSVLAYNIVLLG